jgi:hypothetical protein
MVDGTTKLSQTETLFDNSVAVTLELLVLEMKVT